MRDDHLNYILKQVKENTILELNNIQVDIDKDPQLALCLELSKNFLLENISYTGLESFIGWLEEKYEEETNQQLLMLAWAKYFNELLDSRDAKSLIILGNIFNSQIWKFAGYVYWLIKCNVLPWEIINSGLLQNFFQYHIIDIDELKNTYAFLTAQDDILVNTFLQELDYESCQMKIFLNQKVDKHYKSMNLKGELYEHDEIEIVNMQITDFKLNSLIYFTSSLKNLISVYGIDIVKFLNINSSYHQPIYNELILGERSQQFFDEIPLKFLSSEISFDEISQIFDLVSGKFFTTRINKLISLNPFYIFLLNINQFNFEEHRDNVSKNLELLISTPGYDSLKLLHFLSDMLVNVYNLEEYNPKLLSNQISKIILDLLMPFGNTVPEWVDEAIAKCKYQINVAVTTMLSKFDSTIRHLVREYSKGEIDYDAVLDAWNSQLSMVNLIRGLEIYSVEIPKYLQNKYELQAYLLQSKLNYSHLHAVEFNLEVMLKQFSDDNDTQIRILQESLLSTLIEFDLLNRIIIFAKDENIIDELMYKSFGDHISIAAELFFPRNIDLFHDISTAIKIDVLRVIPLVLTPEKAFEFEMMDQSTYYCEDIKHELVSLFVNGIITTQDDDLRSICFNKLRQLNEKIDFNHIENIDVFSFAQIAVTHGENFLLEKCFEISSEHQLSSDQFHEILNNVLGNNDWRMLHFLCGFTENKKAHNGIIKKHNINLFFDILKFHDLNSSVSDSCSEALTRRNNSDQTPLDIAAIEMNHDLFVQFFYFVQAKVSFNDMKFIIQNASVDAITSSENLNFIMSFKRKYGIRPPFENSNARFFNSGIVTGQRRGRENDTTTETELDSSRERTRRFVERWQQARSVAGRM